MCLTWSWLHDPNLFALGSTLVSDRLPSKKKKTSNISSKRGWLLNAILLFTLLIKKKWAKDEEKDIPGRQDAIPRAAQGKTWKSALRKSIERYVWRYWTCDNNNFSNLWTKIFQDKILGYRPGSWHESPVDTDRARSAAPCTSTMCYNSRWWTLAICQVCQCLT